MFRFLTLALFGFVPIQAFSQITCMLQATSGSSFSSGTSVGTFALQPVASESSDSQCRTYGIQWLGSLAGVPSGWSGAACASGLQNNALVNAYARAGSTGSEYVGVVGHVVRVNAVYSCPSGSTLSGAMCTAPIAASCPSGYWLEGSGSSAKCVKTVLPAGSLPGVGAWRDIDTVTYLGRPGVYKTDDQQGVRHFSTANQTCPSGFSVSGSVCQKSATLVTPASCSLVRN
jgi:hypothetical protein